MGQLRKDFRQLILDKTPLIDVRAPVEFAQGAFPTAVNLPLMDDKEREAVGICYKKEGNEAAMQLGHQLVAGRIKEARISAWKSFYQSHPDAVIYCFRGGARSRIAQAWLKEAGIDIPRIEGGYKAFRRYILEFFENLEGQFEPILLSGYTGAGKTILLKKLDNMIDLEGLAHHRGSAFGAHIASQPKQIDFEHALAAIMIEKLESGYTKLVFEDEGKRIGRLSMPKIFLDMTQKAGIVILHTPLDERVKITLDEYVIQAQADYENIYAQEGYARWELDIKENLARIQKRLGSERFLTLMGLFERACQEEKAQGTRAGHEAWIAMLLKEYYDPMYAYQLEKKRARVLFEGDKNEVLAYLQEHTQ